MERRQHERQRRLRHACAGWERRGKCWEAFVGPKAIDECVKEWQVHVDCPKSGFRGTQS